MLLIATIFFLGLIFFSETTFDIGDGIRHYLISHFSWKHPHIFLDSWGKPFFTLISSPFSQFGMYGITFFNITCGITTAYFLYRIAVKLEIDNAILTIPFLLFAPIYFPTLNSGLTEPFFGLALIASIYFLILDKYIYSSILISFLPFIRTEGFLLLPLFFLLFLTYKNYFATALISLGTFIYSLIGELYYYNDFFWIFNQNPYNGSNKSFYGSGELLHFIYKYDLIWGNVLGVILLIGIIVVLCYTLLNKKLCKYELQKPYNNKKVVILILGCFIIYFTAHSIMWWKGLANSMGLWRVIAGILPCTTLICLIGFNYLFRLKIYYNKIIKYTIFSSLLIIIIIQPFYSEYFPFRYSKEQLLINDVAVWIKDKNLNEKKTYFIHPYLALLLNTDVFDANKSEELWSLYPQIKEEGIGSIPDSTIIIWDSHFGPNECVIPFDTIYNDLNFDLIKTFYPKNRFTTLGENPFFVSIFQKRKEPVSKEDRKVKKIIEISFELENGNDSFNENIEFGKSFKKKVVEFPHNTTNIKFSANVLSADSNIKSALLVLSVDGEEGNNIFWEGKPFVISKDTSFNTVSVYFYFPVIYFTPSDRVSIYVWNKNKKSFLLKDNKIECFGISP